MPRPGPRPYECVRKAWHSERHQPMRGSIIQQIFRVVHQSHNAQIKKNMEWQDKLPIVVFKTEEIMYSKANSECFIAQAEYMNLDTLWDRVNDAINTIIRRDESTETGELLPPCVEAALNLGCIPVRASRSQRHSIPRTYLNPRPQESASVPPRMIDKTIEEQCTKLSPLPSENQLKLSRSPMNANSALHIPKSNCCVIGNGNIGAPPSYPSLHGNIATSHSKIMTAETSSPLKLGLAYPLYYGPHFQAKGSRLSSQVPGNAKSNTIFVGKPVGTSTSEPAEMSALPNLFCPASDITSKRITQPDFGNLHRKPLSTDCDLSLRLGLSAKPGISVDRSSACEIEDVGSISSEDRNRFSDLSSQRNKEFCFFPEKTADNHRESYPSKGLSDHECQNLGVSIKKPKAPVSDNLEDVQFCWQQELSPGQFISQIRGPGL